MSDGLLKVVKRLHDASLDLYHQPPRSHVPVDRADLLVMVEDWRRLGSEWLAERLAVVKLKAENDRLNKAINDLAGSIEREYWSEYAGLEDTRAILDAAMSNQNHGQQ